ncbi:MAG: aldo/keto reductase [Maritimibacter sp.]|nr:aldo/keto reductase [Maritimibacter sp.]
MKRVGEIPQIGFGTWQRDGVACFRGVLDALDIGYRHIDTAEGYNNEEFVGTALIESGLPRDEVWVTTKVAPESFGPGQVRGHVEASLEKLRLDRVDLLLLHYPSIGDEYAIEDYMAQFVEVWEAGLTRHLGVSNFTVPYIDRASALLGDRKIFTNQVELHPFLANRTIVAHCRAKGIPLTAYSPLARGRVVDDPVLGEIAAAHGATPAQVALAWLMAQGYVVIPSAGSRMRIAENFAAQALVLSAAELDRIAALDRGMRLVDGPWCPKWDD